jgi:putative transposase
MMDLSDRVTTVKFLLRDQDSRFTGTFDAVFTADSTRILTSPPQAPRANAIRGCSDASRTSRVIGTLRRELLDRILIVNEHHLRRILATYLYHFNTARPLNRPGFRTPFRSWEGWRDARQELRQGDPGQGCPAGS